MSDPKPAAFSSVQAINGPAPKTWDDYESGCLSTFRGGYHDTSYLRAFQHGMQTVFNLLRAEFPPAEVCKSKSAAPAEPQALPTIKSLGWVIMWPSGYEFTKQKEWAMSRARIEGGEAIPVVPAAGVEELMRAAKDAVQTLRVAVRCGLHGFTEEKTEEIIENHSTIKRLTAALAQLEPGANQEREA